MAKPIIPNIFPLPRFIQNYLCLIIICFFPPKFSFPQSNAIKNNYCNPLEIPLEMAGAFGEIRPGHFHTGLDLRTQNKEGLNVFSIDNGFVSRIKVSATGYGNALYIRHPDGNTSVYAHLRSFNKIIDSLVMARQYEKESFEIDIALNKGDLPVRKGEIIGFSGNSGGSESPHLHFELRNEKEETLNPLLFGFSLVDTLPPVIKKIILYEKGPYGLLKQDISFSGKGNLYESPSPVKVSYPFYIGIESFDPGNAPDIKNGWYEMSVSSDNQHEFHCKLDKISFNENKFVNGFLDFEQVRAGKIVVRSRPDPGMKISWIQSAGFNDPHIKNITARIIDYQKNSAFLNLKLSYTPPSINTFILPSALRIIYPNTDDSYEENGFRIHFREGSLYDTLYFNYSVTKEDINNSLSDTYNIGDPNIPLKEFCEVRLPLKNIPISLRPKLTLVIQNKKNLVPAGGNYVNGFLEGKINQFGTYSVIADTSSPEIVFPSSASTLKITRNEGLSIKIKDNFSGIKKYRATLDSHWVLFSYDQKKGVLHYRPLKQHSNGLHQLEVYVSDQKDNVRVERRELIIID